MTFSIGERREGAALVGPDVATKHGQTAQMRLVDDRPRPGNVGRPIVAPVENILANDGFWHARRAVAAIE